MIQRTRLPWTRRGHRHAQVHFPPLTAEEALLLANLLERVIHALWRAHGHAMAQFLGCRDLVGPLPTDIGSPSVADGPEPTDDDLF